MRKLLLAVIFTLLLVSCAFAERRDFVYVVTIKNTTSQQVANAVIEEMAKLELPVTQTSADQTIFVTKSTFLFDKSTMYTIFNYLPVNNNIILSVTESMDTVQWTIFQNSMRVQINWLIPSIRNIKNKLDGTNIKDIKNEVARTKDGVMELGLTVEKNSDGTASVKNLNPYAYARLRGIKSNDIIVSINGKPFKEQSNEDINTTIENNWKNGDNMILVIRRGDVVNSIPINKNNGL